jgi:hypothetical protein
MKHVQLLRQILNDCEIDWRMRDGEEHSFCCPTSESPVEISLYFVKPKVWLAKQWIVDFAQTAEVSLKSKPKVQAENWSKTHKVYLLP